MFSPGLVRLTGTKQCKMAELGGMVLAIVENMEKISEETVKETKMIGTKPKVVGSKEAFC